MTKAKRSSEGEMESKEEMHINIYIYTRRIKENRGAGQRVEKHPQAGKVSLCELYIYISASISVYSRTLSPQCECWTQLAKVQSRVVSL
jgi:hypothetical protein